ncbi:YdbH domain-containing protein [uncultured Microbulbifer sp.]|uniref:intermembrane phospholipid transport protein YdbH family protein n=1 Tax=uncultured Microbulbifer sp. TaxID=348147 RepID=UPI0026378F5E|nr:YdbH domain-containing protein [uncultured Microbulbifer sp.]
MRVVSRLSIIFAGILMLALLAGISGWLSRHHWLPAVVNHQLHGISVSELRGLTLNRQNNQISAQFDHLILITDTGLRISIDDVQLMGLRTTIRAMRRATNGKKGEKEPTASALGQLRVARVTVHAPDQDLKNSAEPETPHSGTTASNTRSSGGNTSNIPSDSEQFSINDILRTLSNIPLSALAIEQLYWDERFDGYLTLSFQNAPESQPSGQKLSGQIRSSQCADCAINLTFQNPEVRQPSVQWQLSHGEDSVANFHATLNRAKTGKNDTAQDEWTLKSRLAVKSQPIKQLIEELEIPLSPQTNGTETLDWSALLQSVTGQIELGLTGQVPDKFGSTADLTDLIATLATPALSTVLPENLAGVPLALQYSASSPLTVHLATVSPLAVKSAQGDFTLQLTPKIEHPQADGVFSSPLLQVHVALGTSERTPVARHAIRFDGHYDLSQIAPLLSGAKWKSTLGDYRLNGLSGRHRFTGSALLPSLESLSAGKTPATFEQLSTQIELTAPLEFRVSLPEQENPLAAIGWKGAQVQVRASKPLIVSADKIPGAVTLKLSDLEFKATEHNKNPGKNTEYPPILAGTVSRGLCTRLPAVDCAISLKTSLNRLNLVDAATAVEQLDFETSVAVKHPEDTDHTEYTFNNLNLVAAKITSGPATISAPELFTQQAACRISEQETACKIPQLALSIAPLALEDSRISGAVFLEEVALKNTTGKQFGVNIQARFRGENLNILAIDQFKSSIAASGRMALADGLLAGSGQAAAGPLKVDSVWTHSLETGQGKLQLTLPETTFSPNNTLSQAVHGLPADIVDGTLSGSAQLNWPEQGQDHAVLAMKETGLQVGESFIVGVNTEITLQQRGNRWSTEKPAPVSINTADVGVAVNNLHFALALDPTGDLTLQNFAAELLEGVLTSDKLTWNLNGEERRSQLQFTGIAIGALAREMESQNFAASGLLDARIPLVTDKQGVTVENGTIQSRPPGGRLRYYGAFSPAMLGSNPQLKLLAGALEDYNYRDINGTITYPLSGDLNLNLKLTGRSKAIDANRDLIINLNLENNIPTMLRSLQASRDLTDVLEQQVQ